MNPTRMHLGQATKLLGNDGPLKGSDDGRPKIGLTNGGRPSSEKNFRHFTPGTWTDAQGMTITATISGAIHLPQWRPQFHHQNHRLATRSHQIAS